MVKKKGKQGCSAVQVFKGGNKESHYTGHSLFRDCL